MRLGLRSARDFPPNSRIAPPEPTSMAGARLVPREPETADPFAMSGKEGSGNEKPRRRTIAGMLGLPPCSGLHCVIRALWIMLMLACLILFLAKFL